MFVLRKLLASILVCIYLLLWIKPAHMVRAEGRLDGTGMTVATSITSFAVDANGSLWAWGSNSDGRFGDGSTTERNYKVKILDYVVAVSTSRSYTTAITADGKLWAWGIHSFNNLDGNLITGRDLNRPTVIKDRVTAVSAGASHTMVVKDDGSLWASGENRYGQLGNGSTTNSNRFVWIMDDVVAVSAGKNHTAAIKTDGSLWAWGRNSSGQLGIPASEDQHHPVKIIEDAQAVVAAGEHTFVIINGGDLWAWGPYLHDLLLGRSTESYLPHKIMDGVVAVSAGGNVDSIHVAAIRSDTSLWTFGHNSFGQLGIGDTTTRNVPVWIMDDVVAVTASDERSTMATTSDGDLWAWGYNRDGQISNEANILQGHPLRIMDAVMVPGSQSIAMETSVTGQATEREGSIIDHLLAMSTPENTTEPVDGASNTYGWISGFFEEPIIIVAVILVILMGILVIRRLSLRRMNVNYSAAKNGNASVSVADMPHTHEKSFDPSAIENSYHIEKKMRVGKLSCICTVMNKKLNNLWFLKFVSSEYGQLVNKDNVLKLLDHSCLPKIVDVIYRDEGVYLVQTLVEGEYLNKSIDVNTKLTQGELIHLFKQIAYPLSYLHSMRPDPVLHLNLKPSNILVTRDDRIVLVDFGISRRFGDVDSSLAKTAYAAPEQFARQSGGFAQAVTEHFGTLPSNANNWKIGAETDIYSLGVIMFEYSTGQLPSQANLTILKNHISHDFGSIILKCLSLQPTDRYHSVRELMEELILIN